MAELGAAVRKWEDGLCESQNFGLLKRPGYSPGPCGPVGWSALLCAKRLGVWFLVRALKKKRVQNTDLQITASLNSGWGHIWNNFYNFHVYLVGKSHEFQTPEELAISPQRPSCSFWKVLGLGGPGNVALRITALAERGQKGVRKTGKLLKTFTSIYQITPAFPTLRE